MKNNPYHGVSPEWEQYLLEHPELTHAHDHNQGMIEVDGVKISYEEYMQDVNRMGDFKATMARFAAWLAEQK
jgi:hypothetical protein